ncbi:MAG: hypothetical protein A2808_03105 [Candidatus Moranbacteria bacterium RIFCSPHIGHO2_01_FULL_55_24]|nr:MAG: hypothetical protein A2808_03105 [Candidatus Moranbacteria bacterium RIFCSPHIGHO2_01_FULL_55_24]
MVFHFSVFFWSVVFFLGLQGVILNPITLTWSWYLFAIIPLLVVAFLAANRLTGKYADAYLPGLLAVSSPILLSFVDHPTEQQIFVFLCSGMFYFALLGIYRLRYAPNDKTAQAILSTAAMAALFFFFSGIYGFYLNFSFPLWGMMLIFFLGTALTSYETFIGVERENKRRVKIYSVLLGLMMGELVWIMSFWPFGSLTTGAIALIFYFMAWDIAFDTFRKTLSLRRAVIRMFLFSLLIILLLVSSPWRILV